MIFNYSKVEIMVGRGNPQAGKKIIETQKQRGAVEAAKGNPRNLQALPQPGDRSVLPNDAIARQGERHRLGQDAAVQNLLPEDSTLGRISTRASTEPLPGGPVPDDSWIVRNRPRLEYDGRDLGSIGFTPEGKRLRKEAPNRDYSNLYQELEAVENTGLQGYARSGFQWMPPDWQEPSGAVNQTLVQPLRTPAAELVIRNGGKVHPITNYGLQAYRPGLIQPDVAAGVKVNGETIARTNKQLTDGYGKPSQILDPLPIRPMGGGLYRPENQAPWDNTLKVYPEGTQGLIVNKDGSFAAPYGGAFNAGFVTNPRQSTFRADQLLQQINESPDNGAFLWNGKGMSLDDGRVDDRGTFGGRKQMPADRDREDLQAANRFLTQSRQPGVSPSETGQAGIGDAISFARANDRAKQEVATSPTYRSQEYRTADRPLTSAEMQAYLSIEGPQQAEKSRDFLSRRDVQMSQQGGRIRLDPNANQALFAPQNNSGYNDINRRQAIDRNSRQAAALQSEQVAQGDQQYRRAIELGLRAENDRPGILRQEMLPISGDALTAAQRLVNLRDNPTVHPSTLGDYSNHLRSGLPFALTNPQSGNRVKIDPRARIDRHFGRPDLDSLSATFDRSDTLGPGNYNPTFADSNGEVNRGFSRPIGENVILKPDARGILKTEKPVMTEDGLVLGIAEKNRQNFLAQYGVSDDARSFHNSAILGAETGLAESGIVNTSPRWNDLPEDIRKAVSLMDGGPRIKFPDPNPMSPRSASVIAYPDSTMGRLRVDEAPVMVTDAMARRWIEKNPTAFNEEFDGSAFAVKKALNTGGSIASAAPALSPFGGQSYQTTPQGAALYSSTQGRYDAVNDKDVRTHVLESVGQNPVEIVNEHQRTANFTKNVLWEGTADAYNSGVHVYDGDRPLAPNRTQLSSNPEHDWFDEQGNRHQSTIQEVYQIEDLQSGKPARGGTYVDKYGETQQKTMYDILKDYHAVPAGDRPINAWEAQLPEDLLRKGYAAGESKYRLRAAQRIKDAVYGGSWQDPDGTFHPGIGDGETRQPQLQQIFDKDGNVLYSTIKEMDLAEIMESDRRMRAAGLDRVEAVMQNSWQKNPRAEIESEQLLRAMSNARRSESLGRSVENSRGLNGLGQESRRPGGPGAGYEDLRKLGRELPDRQDQIDRWEMANPGMPTPSQYNLDKQDARDATKGAYLPSVVHGGRLKINGVQPGDVEEFLGVPVQETRWGLGKDVSPSAKGWTPDPDFDTLSPEYNQAIADMARYKERRHEPYQEFRAGNIDRETLFDLWNANEASRPNTIPIGGINLSDEIGVGFRQTTAPSSPIAAARIQADELLGAMPEAQLPSPLSRARSGIVGAMPESLTTRPRQWGEREYRPQFADRLDPVNGEPRRQDARSSMLRQIPGMESRPDLRYGWPQGVPGSGPGALYGPQMEGWTGEYSQAAQVRKRPESGWGLWDDRPVAEQVRQSPQRQGIPPQPPTSGLRINNGKSIVPDAESHLQAEAFAQQAERRKTAEQIARYQRGFVQ